VDICHPTRTINPAAKLKDTANTEAPQLSFQRKAVKDFHSRQGDKDDHLSLTTGTDPNAPSSTSAASTWQHKRDISYIADSDSGTEAGSVVQPAPHASPLSPLTFSVFLTLMCSLQPKRSVPWRLHRQREVMLLMRLWI